MPQTRPVITCYIPSSLSVREVKENSAGLIDNDANLSLFIEEQEKENIKKPDHLFHGEVGLVSA